MSRLELGTQVHSVAADNCGERGVVLQPIIVVSGEFSMSKVVSNFL